MGGHHVYGYHKAKGYNTNVMGLTLHFDEDLIPFDSNDSCNNAGVYCDHHELMRQEGRSIAHALWRTLPSGTFESLADSLQTLLDGVNYSLKSNATYPDIQSEEE